MTSKGNIFSWCNGQYGLARSWARLDHALMDALFLSVFSNAICAYLPRSTSDHAPMIIELKKDPCSYGPSPFRFQQIWVEHHNFLDCVRQAWSVRVDGMAIQNLVIKLKQTKLALRAWNIRVFGHTLERISTLENQIEELELQSQLNSDDNLDRDLQMANAELATWRHWEEIGLSQMAKVKWATEGYRNTKFFHACLALKRSKRLLIEPTSEQPNFDGLIDPVISDEENASLLCAPSLEEVYDALSSIPVNSAPGPDGFGSGFYKSCWEVVKNDLWKAVLEFFDSKSLPKFFTASFLVLIPKVDSPTGFDKFRHISLCSVFYKLCPKIIVNRLTGLLPRLVSMEQGAFIPGRSIFENISLTQEMVQSINKRNHGSNIMLKVDMTKAYDRSLVFSYDEWDNKRFLPRRPWHKTSKISHSRKRRLLCNTGFLEGHFPLKYLGVPIMLGRLKQVHFEDMMNKMRKKLSGWKMRLLSSGGKLILLRHVISSMALHLFTVFHIPQVVINKINQMMGSFFWGESNGKDKKKWLAWKHMGMPVVEGGIGVRLLHEVQTTLHIRFAWNLLRALIRGKDVLIWTQPEEGMFSVQFAWQCIRVRGASFEWHSWIWHKSLPLKMSSHFWKAWHRALSVDDRLRCVGISIVSKCDCCSIGHYEDINHVLFEGDFPKKIWLTFSNLFGLPMGRNWEQHVSSWFRRAKSSSQVGVIMGLMPVIITWRLWRRRCLARMEGSLESYDTVIKSISFWVRSLGLMGDKYYNLCRFDGMILEALRIRLVPLKERTCKVVQWHKPPLGWFKLNIDGSSLGNPGSCGTGGVIRNNTR
ncbi:uncharacterized protein LOC122314764 [Carya illinoinensis]|uniref:uncharacterized protein LOC122314764 n=1 Tax=Carya illinoinensis TaxID=32201 RepID=UPI001C722E71|nr:uncharacterized protein LOC122314764 [Carya illinoinensis]